MARKTSLRKRTLSLYEKLSGLPPEERYHRVFPDPWWSFLRDGHSGWTSHPGAIQLGFSDLPRLLGKYNKQRTFIAWSVGLGNPPHEPAILAHNLERAGITKYRIYAVDINPEIIEKVSKTTADLGDSLRITAEVRKEPAENSKNQIIPINADINFAFPRERPDLISFFVVAQYLPSSLQKKLAESFARALRQKGLLVIDRQETDARRLNYQFFRNVRRLLVPEPYTKRPPNELSPDFSSSMWRKRKYYHK